MAEEQQPPRHKYQDAPGSFFSHLLEPDLLQLFQHDFVWAIERCIPQLFNLLHLLHQESRNLPPLPEPIVENWDDRQYFILQKSNEIKRAIRRSQNFDVWMYNYVLAFEGTDGHYNVGDPEPGTDPTPRRSRYLLLPGWRPYLEELKDIHEREYKDWRSSGWYDDDCSDDGRAVFQLDLIQYLLYATKYVLSAIDPDERPGELSPETGVPHETAEEATAKARIDSLIDSPIYRAIGHLRQFLSWLPKLTQYLIDEENLLHDWEYAYHSTPEDITVQLLRQNIQCHEARITAIVSIIHQLKDQIANGGPEPTVEQIHVWL